MKQKFLTGKLWLAIAGIFLLSVAFISCKKDVDVQQPDTPVAGLMAFNLVPDQESVGIDLAPNRLTSSPLGYTSYTGGYNGVYIGDRDVISYDFYSGTDLSSNTFTFEDSSYYSLFVVGANGKYSNLIVKDELDSLPTGTGKSFVRYVNAIPDSMMNTRISISANGNNAIDEDSHFKTVSNFVEIPAGEVLVKGVGSDVAKDRTINLEANKIYTVLFVGIPGSTDPNQAVQIKFITNGEAK